jgi:uncharacterized protein YndB with AHSA1/START domain
MAIDVGQSVQIRRPSADVFDYLAHGENMPHWMGIFETVEQESPGPPGKGTTYRYKMATRGKAASSFIWSEFEPPRKLAWQGPPVPIGPGMGSLEPSGEYMLDEHDGGTRVTMRMHPRTAGLASILSPLMSRSMRKEAAENVQRLKQNLEAAPEAGRG